MNVVVQLAYQFHLLLHACVMLSRAQLDAYIFAFPQILLAYRVNSQQYQESYNKIYKLKFKDSKDYHFCSFLIFNGYIGAIKSRIKYFLE